jgi:hypothetical protein
MFPHWLILRWWKILLLIVLFYNYSHFSLGTKNQKASNARARFITAGNSTHGLVLLTAHLPDFINR